MKGFFRRPPVAQSKSYLGDRMEEAGEAIRDPIGTARREIQQFGRDIANPIDAMGRYGREAVAEGRQIITDIGNAGRTVGRTIGNAANSVRESIGRSIIQPRVSVTPTDPQGNRTGPTRNYAGDMGSGRGPAGGSGGQGTGSNPKKPRNVPQVKK